MTKVLKDKYWVSFTISHTLVKLNFNAQPFFEPPVIRRRMKMNVKLEAMMV